MPKRSKSPPVPPGALILPWAVPVHCCGEGCDATTTLVPMGERLGYEGRLFEEPGWTFGTTEDRNEPGGSFFCRKCFEKE